MVFFWKLVSLVLLVVVTASSWLVPITEGSVVTSLGNTPWPMFRHDLQHTGRSPFLGTQTYSLKWSFDTGGGGIESTPAIDSDGNIYFQAGGAKLYSLDPNGRLRWSFILANSPTLEAFADSSPALDSNSVVYVGSRDGNLYSLFPNGTLRWTFATGGAIFSSPAIGTDGTIYVGSSDNNLYAITQSGVLKWKFATGGVVASSPAIDSRGTIYVGSNDTRLYAIYPSGQLKWSFKTGRGVFSSPAIGVGGMVYVESRDGNLYSVNSAGHLVWKFLISPGCPFFIGSACHNDASPAIGPRGTIYAGSIEAGRGFYAINRDGTLLWEIFLPEIVSSAAVGSDGTIYVGVDDPPGFAQFFPFLALNPDGSLKWGCGDCSFVFYSSPSIAADGTIYIGFTTGLLLAIS